MARPPEPPRTPSQDLLELAVLELVKLQFPNGSPRMPSDPGTTIPGTFITPQSDAWAQVFLECESAYALSRPGMQRYLYASLKRIFHGIRQAAAGTGQTFLIYFWRIALALRNARLHGAQRLENDRSPLLRFLLNYLRILFTSTSPAHPFAQFLTRLGEAFDASPRTFKAVLARAYNLTIAHVRDNVGEHHPIFLSLQSHFIENWRGRSCYSEQSFRVHYESLLLQIRAGPNSCSDQVISLKLDYMFAMKLSPYPQDIAKARILATDLRSHGLDWCQRLDRGELTFDVHTRAFTHSSDWLANILYKEQNPDCYRYLGEAVDLLMCGDHFCRVWAATFSRRLSLWYKGNLGLAKKQRSSAGQKPKKRSLTMEEQQRREKYKAEMSQKKSSERCRMAKIIKTLEHASILEDKPPPKLRGKDRIKDVRERNKREEAGLFGCLRRRISFTSESRAVSLRATHEDLASTQ